MKAGFLGIALLVASGIGIQHVRAAPVVAPPPAVCSGSSAGPGIAPPAHVPLGVPGFHASWYGQSGYPTLCPGERSNAVVAFYNSGSRGWVSGRMGEVAYLGTWNADPGQDEPTVLGGNGEMGSPQTGWPRFNRVAMQPSEYVGPAQVAWFQFAIQAPERPGFYRLYIRPLVEGATWMEDAGVYWQVTVLNPDGTQPAGRISSRVPAPIDDTSPGWAPAQFDNVTLPQSPESGIVLSGGTTGSWTSSWQPTRFPFSQLISSWTADTPAGSWIEVEIQVRTAGGHETRWWRMGKWAYGDETIRRTSINGQTDADGVVETDTFKTRAEKMTAYRARVTLSRSAVAGASPILQHIYALVSDTRSYTPRYPSPRYTDRAMEISVPRYSQEIHAGEFPQYDGGGEAWCSPTSTEMVIEFWNKRPTSAELAFVGGFADPQVDYAARYTYDVAYAGTGNWPFNTAYASRFGLSARVLQLGSLNDAERYIAAGIPLVASITHAPGALPGFLNNAGTAGHLLVIVGFTAAGDVIANDPAATSDATVRRVYGREAFERAWIGGSGGVVYFIAPPNTFVP
ncbi:MAG: peptidase C39 family protein [Chloroflexi bacterium]|nr:MAG: peptidase C39 family protein [Chloroflexota bacterium]